jgi:hypothetical protein
MSDQAAGTINPKPAMRKRKRPRFPDWICICGYRVKDDGTVEAAQEMGNHLMEEHDA